MYRKVSAIDAAPDYVRKRSVASFLVGMDIRLSSLAHKLMGADILTIEDLARLRPSGLRKKFKVSDAIMRRVRRCFRAYGVRFAR